MAPKATGANGKCVVIRYGLIITGYLLTVTRFDYLCVFVVLDSNLDICVSTTFNVAMAIA